MTVAASLELLSGTAAGRGPLIVRWPADEATVRELLPHRLPVLLLIDSDSDPPPYDDPWVDWLRLPVDVRDLDARLDRLRERASSWFRLPRPALDGSGRLCRGDRWVGVTPTEEQLLRVLLANMDKIVPRRELLACGWPATGATDTSLRLQMMRLRERIKPLGLEIRTIRGKGYALASTSKA